MLVKIFGAIDFIAGLTLITHSYLSFPKIFLIVLGIILLIKASLGILKDFASWIDFLCGITLLIYIWITIPVIISFILGFIIIQKAILSFF